MTETRLTYCGNVHPARNLDEWCATVGAISLPALRAASSPGLGSWWNAELAHRLAVDDDARARVADMLERCGLELWTLNVFPFGDFHEDVVKTRVYQPSWADDARVEFTIDAASAASRLAAPGLFPLSTLPVGYGDVDLETSGVNLRAVARRLAEVENASGVRCVVALEPEPFCALETVAATADFLERFVFARDDRAARRHVGVCIDLCHLAVVDEDPLEALADLERRGIAVPKIQVSACLELRDPSSGLERLLAFDEARYLHQTVADTGARALDLGEVAARQDEFRRASRIRSHYHVPVHWDGDVLGSTRAEVERVLAALPPGEHLLEVETYTWGVLGAAFAGAADLAAAIADELRFVRSRLPT